MHYRGRQILNRALIANPNDQNLQIWQARALLLEKTLPATNKAIELLTRISQSQNDSAIDIDVWILLCQAWLQKNEPTNALNVALQALTMFPENKNLLLLKARAEAAHTPELAIPTVRLLHEREPNNAEIAIYLANLYVSINDYRAALTVLKDKFSACDSNMVRKIDITKAIILYRSQDKQQANKLFEMLAAADPNDKAVMLARAEVLIFEHNWDELTGFIGNWCQNHPGYTQPVIIVVNTLLNSKNPAAPEISKKILQNAIAVNSDSSDLISELAKIMHSSGNSGQAAGLYKKLLQLEPDNLYAINNLAWIMCEDQGNLLQALELAEKGLQIAPDYLDLLDTRGMAYFRLGKFDKAVSDFSVCAQKYPDNMPSAAVSYFHLGRAFAALAKKEEAMRYINTAIKLNQKNGGLSANDVAQAHDLLDKLSKGVSYEQAFSVY
jgi:tetratricopeptide (TPR) repeat protein